MLEHCIPGRSYQRIGVAHRGNTEYEKVGCFKQGYNDQKHTAKYRHKNDHPRLII
jgi:hypothetical protein